MDVKSFITLASGLRCLLVTNTLAYLQTESKKERKKARKKEREREKKSISLIVAVLA
jgi:hypothetical protein